MEEIILSPAFTVLLAIVGVYLFVLISREFFLWFLKISETLQKLKTVDERLADIEQALSELPKKLENQSSQALSPVALPPIPKTDDKEQFPLTH